MTVTIDRELVARTKANIRAHYELFDMRDWVVPADVVPECGTAGCLALWVVLTARQIKTPREYLISKNGPDAIPEAAIIALTGYPTDGVDPELHRDIYHTFMPAMWPAEFIDHRALAIIRLGHDSVRFRQVEAELACELLDRVVAKYSVKESA